MTTDTAESIHSDTAAIADVDDDLHRSTVLDLTTEVAPAKLFTIDNQEYRLKSFEHLSPDDEATVTALFARFQRVFQNLELAKNDDAAVTQAKKVRTYREKLIALMTDVPSDVLRGLSAAAQGQILRVIQDEIAENAGEALEEGN